MQCYQRYAVLPAVCSATSGMQCYQRYAVLSAMTNAEGQGHGPPI